MSAILGLGTHLIEVVRMRHLIDRHGELFISRVFTVSEQVYCNERARSAEYFTALWAAKEATFRSLGTGTNSDIAWTDIIVECSEEGQPSICLRGALLAHAESLGVRRFLVSYSPSRAYATATVIALGE